MTIKMVIAFRRNPAMSHERFSEYWVEHHGPLVREVADVLAIRGYVQSTSVAAAQSLAAAATEEDAVAFDAIAELWYDSEEEMQAAMATPEGRAALTRLHEDEAVFLDPRTPNFVMIVREHEILPFRGRAGHDPAGRRG